MKLYSNKALLSGAALVLFSRLLTAGTVNIVDPSPTYQAMIASCNGPTGATGVCTSTAFVDPNVANAYTPFYSPSTFNGTPPGVDDYFDIAFGNWTNTTAGTGWNLDVSSNVLVGNFDVQQLQAVAPNATVGGMNMVISFDGYDGQVEVDGDPNDIEETGPTAASLTWVQALYINYQPSVAGVLNPPAETLDTFSFSGGGTANAPASGPFSMPCTPIGTTNAPNVPSTPQTAYCDPVYPFQNAPTDGDGVNGFGDGPRGFWSYPASFRAVALLATIDPTNKTVTVYQGVSYGFDLAVPEPSYFFISAGAILLIVFLRRRKPLSPTGA